MSTTEEIIEKIVYITIATVDETGQPWNTPVYSAYDSDGNFYWGSYVNSQHSKNISANNKIFIVVYDSTIPAGEGEGFYVKAQAQELTQANEIARAHKLLQDRRPIPYWKLEEVQPDKPVHLYKAVPEKTWRNSDDQINGIYIDKLEEES